mmetsp:Transcript_12394/g.35466  ORF Transcript_12394/g.35466 Transcript_12394/m.35466 type:complete len:749 (-) Transcript_12394:57-2303(-)
MSDVDLDEFLDTLDDDALMGSGGGGEGVVAFSSGPAAAKSSSHSSNGGGRKKSSSSPSSSPSSPSSSPSSSPGKKGKAGGGAIVKFPAKLHDMLTQSQLSSDIMEWRQDGTCFKILNRDRLASELLPIYFDHNNYTSFSRQLNGWGFKRLKKKKGTSAGRGDSSEGCYYHENFHRDRPEEASKMRRPTSSDKSASGKGSAAGIGAGRPQGVTSPDDQTVSSGGTEFGGSGTAQPASQACSSVTGGSIPLPKRATFPVKLHAILSRPDLSNIISWCENGAAFRVQRPKEFAGNVLPCYFDHNNFSSFLRKVRGWGFKRIKSGPDAGSYYHQLFHRDKPYLALRMKRQTAGSTNGGADSVGHSRASEAIAAHRRGKTKKQSHMDAEFSTPSPPCSSSNAPAASAGPAPAAPENDKVMESLIHMQKVLNEQQELLRQQILEVSDAAAAEAGAGGGTVSAAATNAPDQIASGDTLNNWIDEEASTHSKVSRATGIRDPEAALYSHELVMLETELNKFSADAEPALATARTRCPDITDNVKLRLLFLWCTDFDVVATAKRMAGYWRLRVELFGVERAFLPLSSDSILNPEDRALILNGAFRILPNTDANGRTIIYIDQQKLHGSSFDPMSAARAVWYEIHTILTSDSERAKRGIVGIANFRNSSWSPNYSWMTIMSNTFKCTPFEVKGVHLAHAGMFARVLAPITNLVIGPWIRDSSFTLQAHEGQDAAVLSSLARFGIPHHCVPAELGGGSP